MKRKTDHICKTYLKRIIYVIYKLKMSMLYTDISKTQVKINEGMKLYKNYSYIVTGFSALESIMEASQISKMLRVSDSTENLKPAIQVREFISNLTAEYPIHAKHF